MKLTLPWTATNGHSNGATDKLEDVRHALGREVDHLAQVAAQMGRDAGAHADGVARDVAKDAQKQTGAAMNRIAALAATLGPTLAVMGREKMRGLGQQAQTLGSELGKVRITTEPPRGTSVLPGIALIGGLGIGIGMGMALMYLLDPQRGKRRRQSLMARIARLTKPRVEKAEEKELDERLVGVMVDEGGPVMEAESANIWPEGTPVPSA